MALLLSPQISLSLSYSNRPKGLPLTHQAVRRLLPASFPLPPADGPPLASPPQPPAFPLFLSCARDRSRRRSSGVAGPQPSAGGSTAVPPPPPSLLPAPLSRVQPTSRSPREVRRCVDAPAPWAHCRPSPARLPACARGGGALGTATGGRDAAGLSASPFPSSSRATEQPTTPPQVMRRRTSAPAAGPPPAAPPRPTTPLPLRRRPGPGPPWLTGCGS